MLVLLFSLKLSIELNEVISSFFIYFCLFIYFWLHCIFVAALYSLVVVSRDHSSLLYTGSSLQWLLLWSTGSRLTGFSGCNTWVHQLQSTGSVFVLQGFSCSVACGIFPDQGSNPCPLHWQVDAYPLHHQGSPRQSLFKSHFLLVLIAHMIKRNITVNYLRKF